MQQREMQELMMIFAISDNVTMNPVDNIHKSEYSTQIYKKRFYRIARLMPSI
jgi:hypothetical protein